MEIEHRHTLDEAGVQERLRAFGDYLSNKHGMQVAWEDDGSAHVTGKYTVVQIDVRVRNESGLVQLKGKDPGRLLRGTATKYLKRKLAEYLDPNVAPTDLARR